MAGHGAVGEVRALSFVVASLEWRLAAVLLVLGNENEAFHYFRGVALGNNGQPRKKLQWRDAASGKSSSSSGSGSSNPGGLSGSRMYVDVEGMGYGAESAGGKMGAVLEATVAAAAAAAAKETRAVRQRLKVLAEKKPGGEARVRRRLAAEEAAQHDARDAMTGRERGLRAGASALAAEVMADLAERASSNANANSNGDDGDGGLPSTDSETVRSELLQRRHERQREWQGSQWLVWHALRLIDTPRVLPLPPLGGLASPTSTSSSSSSSSSSALEVHWPETATATLVDSVAAAAASHAAQAAGLIPPIAPQQHPMHQQQQQQARKLPSIGSASVAHELEDLAGFLLSGPRYLDGSSRRELGRALHKRGFLDASSTHVAMSNLPWEASSSSGGGGGSSSGGGGGDKGGLGIFGGGGGGVSFKAGSSGSFASSSSSASSASSAQAHGPSPRDLSRALTLPLVARSERDLAVGLQALEDDLTQLVVDFERSDREVLRLRRRDRAEEAARRETRRVAQRRLDSSFGIGRSHDDDVREREEEEEEKEEKKKKSQIKEAAAATTANRG